MSGAWGRGRPVVNSSAASSSSSPNFPALTSNPREGESGSPSSNQASGSKGNPWFQGSPLILERLMKKPPVAATVVIKPMPAVSAQTPRVSKEPSKEPKILAEESKKSPEPVQEPPTPLTEAEMEAVREKRKQKREARKVQKRLKKENDRRLEMYQPKNSKISLITAKPSIPETKPPAKAPKLSGPVSKSSDPKIRFQHVEFPDIDEAKAERKPTSGHHLTVISKVAHDTNTGKLLSDAESGSEWETDVDDLDLAADIGSVCSDDNDYGDVDDDKHYSSTDIEVDSAPISYSSILKKPQSSRSTHNIDQKELHSTETEDNLSKKSELVVKKVKRSDPITFELATALSVKKPQKKKVLTRVVVKPTVKPRNPLDSTAPTQRRGKEREHPKKKKLSKMRRIIMEDRARRRRQEIAKTGSSIPPTTLQQPYEMVYDQGIPEPEASKDLETPVKGNLDSDVIEATSLVIVPTESQNTQSERFADKQRSKLHSRKFREYCNHTLSPELNDHVRALMRDLIRFQDHQYFMDPIHSRAKRRYVVGLREIRKFMQVNKIQLLLIAPDIEPVKNQGGLNDMICELMDLAEANNTPVAFTLNRWKLGKACARKVAVSAIGIINYQGSNDHAKEIIRLVSELKLEYDQMLEDKLRICDTVPKPETLAETAVSNETTEAEKIRLEFITKIRELALG